MGEESKPAVSPEAPKVYTLQDITNHNTLKDCWLVIHGKVYDVTKFMDEHPGGDEVMLSSTGKDATDDFEDVGHSTAARKDLDNYYIGEFDVDSLPVKPTKAAAAAGSSASAASSSGVSIFTTVLQFLVPVAILALAVAVRYLTKKEVVPKGTSAS